jgi:plasmid stability protein
MLRSALGDYPGTNRDFGTPFQKSGCGGPAGLVLTADTSLTTVSAPSSSKTSPHCRSSCWYHYDTGIREDRVMPNVLLRDLDEDVLKQLKAAAKANGRSLQAEIHDVLRRANIRNLAETRRLSSKWLRRLGGADHSDSAALIREDRDTR